MTTATRDIGDQETLSAAFTNGATPPAPTDSSAVTLKIREPDGTITTKTSADSPAALSNPATGTWTYNHTYTQAGRHFFEWSGTGAVVAAVPGERYVVRSNVA